MEQSQHLIQQNDPTLYPPLFLKNRKTCCQCVFLFLFVSIMIIISIFLQSLPIVMVDSSYSY